MLTAKLEMLDIAWSATPQPRRRTRWLASRRTTIIGDFLSHLRGWTPASAAMHTVRAEAGYAEHAGGRGISGSLARYWCRFRKGRFSAYDAASRRPGQRTAVRGSVAIGRTATR